MFKIIKKETAFELWTRLHMFHWSVKKLSLCLERHYSGVVTHYAKGRY